MPPNTCIPSLEANVDPVTRGNLNLLFTPLT